MAATKIAFVLFFCLLGLCRGDSESVSRIVTQSFYKNVINQVGNGCTGKRFYTRNSFVEAVNIVPNFAQSVTRREIATMFAHITHETRHFCNLEETTQLRRNKPLKYGICDSPVEQRDCFPPPLPPSKGYLSSGQSLTLDLLRQSEIVGNNPTIAFRKGLSFWMNSVRPVLNKGFGATIKAINGMECKGGNPGSINARIGYYRDYCRQLGVDPGPNLIC